MYEQKYLQYKMGGLYVYKLKLTTIVWRKIKKPPSPETRRSVLSKLVGEGRFILNIYPTNSFCRSEICKDNDPEEFP